jgi:S1-C subfamily serine protease
VRLALAGALGLALAGAGCGGEKVVVQTRTTTVAAAPSPGAPLQSAADVVASVLPSVVNVRTKQFGSGEDEGSGVVVGRDGVIVTNYHVIEGGRVVDVAFNDGRHKRTLRAQVVGTAKERDLAVLRVAAHDLRPVAVGNSGTLRLGDPVLAIGFPLGLGGPTVTQGIVSGLDRTVTPAPGTTLEGLLQTDAAINPGNSGGPLVDGKGRLVGINTAAANAGAAENVGFAIAIDEAMPVIREIRNKPPSRRAWLGVVLAPVSSATDAAQLGLPGDVRGAVIVSVQEGSPAAAAGLKEGEVIAAVAGSAVHAPTDVIKALARLEPGNQVSLGVVDAFGPRRVGVKLARRPATLP